MDISEFLREPEKPKAVEKAIEPEPIIEADDDIDVQKAVVESLAADKAEQDERLAEQDERIAALQRENNSLKSQIAVLEDKLAQQSQALAKVGEVLAANAEAPIESSKIALLDREVELKDRYPGESRDTVLEVIKESRDAAEQEGRLRRAQVLESVLVANEPVGNLAKKRDTLDKFFRENGNILSGPVIDELNKQGISYKNGEDYLLLSEILKRNF